MGRVVTAFEMRLKRAQALVEQGAVRKISDGFFAVRSQNGSGDKEYHVIYRLSNDPRFVFSYARCSCPDWEKMREQIVRAPWNLHPGISRIGFIPVCKHVLASLLHADVFQQVMQKAAQIEKAN